MAKVGGPLYSMTASGKIANAMVHFKWKGLAVVRQWIKPKNDKTEDQGDVRLMLGGLGRAIKAVKNASLYKDDAKEVAGTINTFGSKFVQYIRQNVLDTVTHYEADALVFDAHPAKTAFNTAATALGLNDFDIVYAGTETAFVRGYMLYLLAKYAIAVHAARPDLFNRAPYDKDLASWEEADVTAFQTDLSPVA